MHSLDQDLPACLPAHLQALQSTASVFTNGFVFDELPLNLVKSAIRTASEAGAAVCFDPGAWPVGIHVWQTVAHAGA